MSTPGANSTLDTIKPYLPTASIVVWAFLAGNRRFIKYFPGASSLGLMMTAGIGFGTSLVADYISPNDSEHREWKHIFGKATGIFLATAVVSTLAAKLLKGRVTLPLRATAMFSGALALTTTVFSSKTQKKSPLEIEHDKYTADHKAFRALDIDARSQFVKKCFDAGLPPISLWEANIKDKYLDDFNLMMKKLYDYTPQQLGWLREMVMCRKSSDFNDVKSLSDFYHLNKRCQELKIPPMKSIPSQDYDLTTPSLFEDLEKDPSLLSTIIAQNTKNPDDKHFSLHSWAQHGFLELSPDDQKKFKELMPINAILYNLPIRITKEVIDRAQKDPFLCDTICVQFNRKRSASIFNQVKFSDFGFSALAVIDQQRIKYRLYALRYHTHFPVYIYNDDLVNLAKANKDAKLSENLILGLIYEAHSTFTTFPGFENLSPKADTLIRQLFAGPHPMNTFPHGYPVDSIDFEKLPKNRYRD